MSDDAATRTTDLLARLRDGERDVEGELLGRLYADLREIAAAYLSRERTGHTLQPTALIHEAYLKLVGGDAGGAETRRAFLGVAARAMRQVLVDHARTRGREKRGGDRARITLDRLLGAQEKQGIDVVALDDALNLLSDLHERQARVVELRFFGGMTYAESGDVLGVSPRTVEADWRMARAWLQKALA